MSSKHKKRPPLSALRLSAIAMMVLALGALLACSDNNSVAESDSAVPMAVGDEDAPVMRFTGAGFEPDTVEIYKGASLLIRNETENAVTFLVAGTAEDGGPGEVTGGGFREYRFSELGAQVITVEGDGDFAATVMVIAGPGQ